MSLLFNPTDDVLQFTYATRPPLIDGDQELTFPPTGYTLPPGSVTEVPDAAAVFAVEYLGPKGVQIVTLQSDLAEARRIGREAWLRWCELQVARYQKAGDEMLHAGLPRPRPDPGTLRAGKLVVALRAELDHEAEALAALPLSAPAEDLLAPETSLTPEQWLARQAERQEAISAQVAAAQRRRTAKPAAGAAP